LEIIERAKDAADGELVPFNTNEKDFREEINRRTCKAGYTTKYGECPHATKIQTTVPFGKTKLNIWPRDENGQLIDD